MGSIDEAWERELASTAGQNWLKAWDLSRDQVHQKRRPISGALPQHPRVFDHSAESMVADMLFDRRSLLHRHLKFKLVDLSPPWIPKSHNWLDPHEAFRLAYDRGYSEAYEIDVLRACHAASPPIRSFFQDHNLNLDDFPACENPYSSPRLPNSRVHQGLALAGHPAIQDWMAELGITPFRLEATIRSLDDDLGPVTNHRPMHWLEPASQEARRLGSPIVTPEHLLLGLLCEPRGFVCRLLGQQGIDLQQLRRQFQPAPPTPIEEMTFSPDLLEICQRAHQRDGQDPSAAVLLECMLEQGVAGLPSIALPQVPSNLQLEKLHPAMTRQQVRETLGPPGFDEDQIWIYREVRVHFEGDKITQIQGTTLYDHDQPVLRLGDSWIQVETVLGPRPSVQTLLLQGRLAQLIMTSK